MTLAEASCTNESDDHISQERREVMITDNVDLVHYVVGRVAVHLPDGVDREDLVSAGLIGLIKAVDRYDPTRGTKFRTYASTVIRGEVMESLRSEDWAPRSVRRQTRRLEQTVMRLQDRLGRQPTDHEISSALEMEIDEYYELLSQTSRTNIASLQDIFNRPDSEGSGSAEIPDPGEYANPEAVMEDRSLMRIVSEAVEQLPERDRLVIGLYYQEGLTLSEIGEILDVTESRVCQIHTQAIVRLRAFVQRQISLP
ncbi:MAG: sigma-70 family RNA polymerase sigma factor [Armatimonadota bacterium]